MDSRRLSLSITLTLVVGCSESAPSSSTKPAELDATAPVPNPSDDEDAGNEGDASARDGGGDRGPRDGSCPSVDTVTEAGTVCAGFGKGSPCDPACGLPAYGYVCTEGAPPGLPGCVRANRSSFGDTYCCPDLACVRSPFQDSTCAGGARYVQCATNPDGGLLVAPPAGCVAASGPPPYRYYCCP